MGNRVERTGLGGPCRCESVSRAPQTDPGTVPARRERAGDGRGSASRFSTSCYLPHKMLDAKVKRDTRFLCFAQQACISYMCHSAQKHTGARPRAPQPWEQRPLLPPSRANSRPELPGGKQKDFHSLKRTLSECCSIAGVGPLEDLASSGAPMGEAPAASQASAAKASGEEREERGPAKCMEGTFDIWLTRQARGALGPCRPCPLKRPMTGSL